MIVIRMLLDLCQMRFQRILGGALEIDVDRGVNAIPFVDRAIPSNGRNHLLPDVIDSIRLTLSSLTAADCDLLSACTSALFRADKSKVSHPVERETANLTRIIAVVPWR